MGRRATNGPTEAELEILAVLWETGPAAVRRMFYLLYEHQKYIVISMSIRRNDPAGARRYATESLAAMDNFRRTGKAVF